MCKVYTGYCGTSEIEYGLCACTVDNPLAKARGLSLRTGAQPMLYFPLDAHLIRPQGYKTFFMLNSAEYEILNAYKYKNIQKISIF